MSSTKQVPLAMAALVLASCTTPTATSTTTTTTGLPSVETTSTVSAEIEEPTALRLAITGGFADAQFVHFRDALAKVSSGALVIEFADEWAITGTDADVEQQIVGAVISGVIDLGWVGSRAFAELGANSFDALTAPFLIDDYSLQAAVLATDIPDRMLDGLDEAELTGLAVIGGGLRKPIAVEGPLRNPDDFAGLTFHGWHSERNAAVIEALGATYIGVAGWERDAGLEDGTIGGFEHTIGGYDDKLGLVNYMTANVALWPGTGVLIANTDRLTQLSETENQWLRQAVTDTVNQSVELSNVEADMVDEICSRGGRFALASEVDLEALREAVQPVYADLKRTAETAAYISEIEALKAEIPVELPTIPEACLAE